MLSAAGLAPVGMAPKRGPTQAGVAPLPVTADGRDGPSSSAAAPTEYAALWTDACSVLDLLAVDLAGLGGACVRAQAGPVRTCWLQRLTDIFPVVRRMPASIGDAALLGGLDLAATLQAGRPVAARGLLVGAEGGVVVAAMAERIAPGLAGRLAAALDAGAGFGLVALDEGAGSDEACPAPLLDRLAFHIELGALSYRDAAASPVDRLRLTEAQVLLQRVEVPDEVVHALCGTALALGVGSARAPLLALRAARAAAALDGKVLVSLAHAGLAARLVLAPRATRLPDAEGAPEEVPPDAAQAGDAPPEDGQAANGQPPAAEAAQAQPSPAPDQREPGRAKDAGGDKAPTPPGSGVTQATELLLDAARAAIPAGLLARLQTRDYRSAGPAGRQGAAQKATQRGRPVGVRAAPPEHGARLNLIETLRAAAPWQALRRREASQADAGAASKATLGDTAPDVSQTRALADAGSGAAPPDTWSDGADPDVSHTRTLTDAGTGVAVPNRWSDGADVDVSHTRTLTDADSGSSLSNAQTSGTAPNLSKARALADAGSGSAVPDARSASAAPDASPGSTLPDAGSGRTAQGVGPRHTVPDESPGRVLLRRDDFRVTRMEARSRTTTIFVVDASGSSALNRLAEAKGAVELLLADCYRRRDQVAVVAFRGRSAQVLLPPTRSLVRAKRSLAGLPGGGGTPLAAGIDAAFLLAETARRSGAAPTLVLLTDGRANVTRAGTAGRDAAAAEAAQAARRVRASGIACLVLDISPRPAAEAGRLARDMGALYIPLPYANAAAVSAAVRAAARQ